MMRCGFRPRQIKVTLQQIENEAGQLVSPFFQFGFAPVAVQANGVAEIFGKSLAVAAFTDQDVSQPAAAGRVVDWNYDVYSQSHNMRPGDPDGVNLLASWYLDKPHQSGPARQAAQPNGAGDRNAITLYDFPRQRTTHHLIKEQPIRTSALIPIYDLMLCSRPAVAPSSPSTTTVRWSSGPSLVTSST